ncbi:MAG TPA: RNA polymerase sigma factor RpoD/SigA [Thermoanaerobaculia bacterium]|mgnify:CR=1 FL=1|nr:RNA polymerase sigma factor RpoD/SigA [Thermoanaerobaculia bacterium]HUM30961.1 RNA polymerase sigma factor RpoD/SigA [Thermoanaerobaculia bacterium]HXK69379.1 RNA polymerase sigma factor RpoD/SigA [Thermoanaerobaculia bacterium]
MIDAYFNESQDLDYYIKEINRFPMLTPEQEKELGHKIRQGDKTALKSLVESNLRFVVHYAHKFKNPNVSLMDLVNEGNIGLIQAAERYDPTMENRFITYAIWWIRQAILHAISQASGLTMPQRRVQQLYQMSKVIHGLKRKLKRSPTLEEVAEEMDIPVAEAKILQQVSGEFVSLNAPLKSDDPIELYEALPQKNEPSPEYYLLEEAFELEVRHLLEELQPRERQVIELRFGFVNDNPLTLREIAEMMGMSRERVRQLEQRALRKIRSKQRARKLLGYLN